MTSRTGTKGFTLIEVLVACVILFAGLGAILTAYSGAMMTLDATADMIACHVLLQERASVLELQAKTDEGGLQGASGRLGVGGHEYSWTAEVRHKSVTPLIRRENAVIRVCRNMGGQPRIWECEWAFFAKPSKWNNSP